MSAPKVCRQCGGVIEDPQFGSHVCQKCAEEAADRMLLPDSSDLTHRLHAAKRSRLEWELAAGLAWKIMVLGVAGVAVYWLAKQALG